jgi:hypothetical protein
VTTIEPCPITWASRRTPKTTPSTFTETARLLVGERANVALARENAGVQAREVDGADPLPRRGVGDVEACREVERLDVAVAFEREARADRTPEAALAAGDDCLHGSSTTLPM